MTAVVLRINFRLPIFLNGVLRNGVNKKLGFFELAVVVDDGRFSLPWILLLTGVVKDVDLVIVVVDTEGVAIGVDSHLFESGTEDDFLEVSLVFSGTETLGTLIFLLPTDALSASFCLMMIVLRTGLTGCFRLSNT